MRLALILALGSRGAVVVTSNLYNEDPDFDDEDHLYFDDEDQDADHVEIDGRLVRDLATFAMMIGAENIVTNEGRPIRFASDARIHGQVDLFRTALNIGRYVDQQGLHVTLRHLPDDVPLFQFLDRIGQGWLCAHAANEPTDDYVFHDEVPQMDYKPTLTQAEFDRLLALRKQLMANQPELPGIPMPFPGVCGPLYGVDGAPRLVYSGKATYEEASASLMQASDTDAAQAAAEWGKASPLYNTPYWRNLDAICEGLGSRLGISFDRSQAVWTNVAKLTGLKGNPEGALFNAQRQTSAEIVRAEMARLAPDVLWIVTGNWKQQYVHDLFDGQGGRDAWIRPNATCMYRCDEDAGRIIVWTNHPQAKRAEPWAAERDMLLDVVAKFLATRLVPNQP